MKAIIAWVVGLAMGIGGLLAWGVFDKRIEVAFRMGPTTPGANPELQGPASGKLAPLAKTKSAAPPQADLTALSSNIDNGAAPAAGTPADAASKAGAAPVGDAVSSGKWSTEKGNKL